MPFKSGETAYLVAFDKLGIFHTLAKVEVLTKEKEYHLKAIKTYYDDFYDLVEGFPTIVTFPEKKLYREEDLERRLKSNEKAQIIVSIFEFPNFIGGM